MAIRAPLWEDCPKLAVAPVSDANSPTTISEESPEAAFFLHPEKTDAQNRTAAKVVKSGSRNAIEEERFRVMDFTNWEMAIKESSFISFFLNLQGAVDVRLESRFLRDCKSRRAFPERLDGQTGSDEKQKGCSDARLASDRKIARLVIRADLLKDKKLRRVRR
jgi:hypothetical protein